MPVAVAVVRGDLPDVFVARNLTVLNWVLALEWVARADPATMDGSLRDELRRALLEERWADAVLSYMEHVGTVVDVYEDHEIFEAQQVSMGPTELQFRPLFRD